MAKKKDEKDVLVVRDEKTGEISVVAGLNADGTPKRTPAKAENAQSFLQFDRHGDVLDNFFKNFFRQCKEPSRFGFYRIAADQVDSMLGVMKDLLQHPYQNKQILAPHKIDTFPYQQQVQEEMAAQKTEKQEPQKQENMEQQKEQQESPQQTQGRQGYQPINESKINWQELEDRWGVKRDDLEKSGDLTKMLNYGKSDLVKVKPTFGGESFELDARLSFKKDGEGNVSLVPHFIRKEQKLDDYRKLVSRKIKAKQTADLLTATNSYKLAEEEAANFNIRFDKAFIDLYPNFVEEFNQLLLPEKQIVLPAPNSLTKELRIYALMRLGITDGQELATLLFYSTQTIYNYKAAIRKRAKDLTTFDAAINRLCNVIG